jgi:hypothetical protein
MSRSAEPLLWHGLGDSTATLQILVDKAPPMQEFQQAAGVMPLLPGQVGQIGAHCGNGWRKVFNVYSKLIYALPAALQPSLAGCSSWQQYRDNRLLQPGSSTALLFGVATALAVCATPPRQQVRLIAGRQHARQLIGAGAPLQLVWLDSEFAIDVAQRLVVCPYLDYRQLSDEKIRRLANLLQRLTPEPKRLIATT